MKRTFFGPAAVVGALASVLTLSFGLPARAQEKAAPAKAAPKPAASFLTGAVEALDEAKGTLTVRSRKGVVRNFVVDEKAREQVRSIQVGDRVVVKHVDGTALSIVKPGVKKKEPPREAPAPEGKAAAPGGRK